MGANRAFRAFLTLILAIIALTFISGVSHARVVMVEPGRSAEQVEKAAGNLLLPRGVESDAKQALAEYRRGSFVPEILADDTEALHDWRKWIALSFAANESAGGDEPMRRVIGIGGIFVELPRVFLTCDGGPMKEILASQTGPEGTLEARYFTYVRTRSFAITPGQQCLALINVASNDTPNLGIFREGDLGNNQVVAVLLKAGFTVTLLIIGLALAIVSYLTNRPLTMLMGFAYSITMLQNDASLFTTTFAADAMQGRAIWEGLMLLTIFACYWVFLFAFRAELRLTRPVWWRVPLTLLPLPLVYVAYVSNSTPDLLWAFYLALFLYALAVALRFDVSRRLRYTAGAILTGAVVAAILVEPYYLGRFFTDLTIEYVRDVIRLATGLGMLLLVVVDTLRTRSDRDKLTAERIAALQVQAEASQRLLDAEREYVRAREAASRRKAQLDAARHDIRQPIVGLKNAVASETENLSPDLLSRLNQAVATLEQMTGAYSADGETSNAVAAKNEGEYPVNLILQATRDMFGKEASRLGIVLQIDHSDRKTRIPALALIRAVSNLVANALHHAKASKVSVTVSEEGPFSIMVSDDGAGLTKDQLERLRLRGAKGEDSSGEGLGLAIVQDLARSHGFDLALESQPEKGTTAHLRLGEHI